MTVQWGITMPASAVRPAASNQDVDWDDSTRTLVGREDAYEHTPLQAGETIAFCQRDQVGYHIATWQFLENAGHGCCICGSHNMQQVRLPGAGQSAPASPAPVSAYQYDPPGSRQPRSDSRESPPSNFVRASEPAILHHISRKSSMTIPRVHEAEPVITTQPAQPTAPSHAVVPGSYEWQQETLNEWFMYGNGY